MEIANISYKTSITATMRNMPIGVEQCIPGNIFSADNLRKTASKLKRFGLEFKVSNLNTIDTFVIRLK